MTRAGTVRRAAGSRSLAGGATEASICGFSPDMRRKALARSAEDSALHNGSLDPVITLRPPSRRWARSGRATGRKGPLTRVSDVIFDDLINWIGAAAGLGTAAF